MPEPRFATITRQVAARLADDMRQGRWGETLPGRDVLARELGVSGNTVEAALRQLQRDGLLVSQGPGRRRRIVRTEDPVRASLRLAILPYDPLAQTEGYILELQRLLTSAGHLVNFPRRSLVELGMEVGAVARMVERTEADAWVVTSGSRDVLEWFVETGVPVCALFGRRRGLPIAGVGPDKAPAYVAAVRRLVGLGHRRIVLLVRGGRRAAGPGQPERAALEELGVHGLGSGSYHLPDWEDTPGGFYRLLDSLFAVTPPTALIIDEAFLFAAAQQHLARRGVVAPEGVSLVCTDPDPTFSWCRPTVAHIRWDPRPVVRRIVRWVDGVAAGKPDRRQTLTAARFVDGGTVGVVPRGDARR